jgi:hypothetical protein
LSSTEFSGALDLSGADTKGFPALEDGTYDFELFSWEMAATKGGTNPDGTPKKMPEGTPMLKVQLKCIEPEHENRRAFDQFVIPNEDYDAEKRNKMLGALVRFFVAMGMEESDVKSKKFDMFKALEDLTGEPVKATLIKKRKYNTTPEQDEWDNEVRGYKRIGDAGAAKTGGKLL